MVLSKRGWLRMFDVGWIEIVSIVCCIVLFIKPEDLPDFFQMIGKIYAQVSRVGRVFMDEFSRQ